MPSPAAIPLEFDDLSDINGRAHQLPSVLLQNLRINPTPNNIKKNDNVNCSEWRKLRKFLEDHEDISVLPRLCSLLRLISPSNLSFSKNTFNNKSQNNADTMIGTEEAKEFLKCLEAFYCGCKFWLLPSKHHARSYLAIVDHVYACPPELIDKTSILLPHNLFYSILQQLDKNKDQDSSSLTITAFGVDEVWRVFCRSNSNDSQMSLYAYNAGDALIKALLGKTDFKGPFPVGSWPSLLRATLPIRNSSSPSSAAFDYESVLTEQMPVEPPWPSILSVTSGLSWEEVALSVQLLLSIPTHLPIVEQWAGLWSSPRYYGSAPATPQQILAVVLSACLRHLFTCSDAEMKNRCDLLLNRYMEGVQLRLECMEAGVRQCAMALAEVYSLKLIAKQPFSKNENLENKNSGFAEDGTGLPEWGKNLGGAMEDLKSAMAGGVPGGGPSMKPLRFPDLDRQDPLIKAIYTASDADQASIKNDPDVLDNPDDSDEDGWQETEDLAKRRHFASNGEALPSRSHRPLLHPPRTLLEALEALRIDAAYGNSPEESLTRHCLAIQELPRILANSSTLLLQSRTVLQDVLDALISFADNPRGHPAWPAKMLQTFKYILTAPQCKPSRKKLLNRCCLLWFGMTEPATANPSSNPLWSKVPKRFSHRLNIPQRMYILTLIVQAFISKDADKEEANLDPHQKKKSHSQSSKTNGKGGFRRGFLLPSSLLSGKETSDSSNVVADYEEPVMIKAWEQPDRTLLGFPMFRAFLSSSPNREEDGSLPVKLLDDLIDDFYLPFVRNAANEWHAHFPAHPSISYRTLLFVGLFLERVKWRMRFADAVEASLPFLLHYLPQAPKNIHPSQQLGNLNENGKNGLVLDVGLGRALCMALLVILTRWPRHSLSPFKFAGFLGSVRQYLLLENHRYNTGKQYLRNDNSGGGVDGEQVKVLASVAQALHGLGDFQAVERLKEEADMRRPLISVLPHSHQ